MMMKLGVLELGKQIREGSVTAMDAVDASLFSIREKEEALHAFITVQDRDTLMKRAEEVQRGIENKTLKSPLAGVPFAAKDNLCTKGIRTTCGSRILENYIPTYTAEAVKRLEDAGCILMGKTNMDEFAMGSTTETSYFGATKNPLDAALVPGGSSGGSAAAVASGEVAFALGSDTGGSVRQPAAFCGIVGMKPSYGAVSRYGLVAYGSSLEQVGVLTRTVSDAAAVMSVISGKDEKDSTSVSIPEHLFDLSDRPGSDDLRVADIQDFPLLDLALPTYYILACAEASSNLERFDGVKYGHRAAAYEDLTDMYQKTRTEGFGWEVKRRILAGTFVLSAGHYEDYYRKAMAVRDCIRQELNHVFEEYDLIVSPTTPVPAPALGTSLQNPMEMWQGDRYTVLANLAGLPAISVPSEDGSGIQILGKPFSDNLVLQAVSSGGSAKMFSEYG